MGLSKDAPHEQPPSGAPAGNPGVKEPQKSGLSKAGRHSQPSGPNPEPMHPIGEAGPTPTPGPFKPSKKG